MSPRFTLTLTRPCRHPSADPATLALRGMSAGELVCRLTKHIDEDRVSSATLIVEMDDVVVARLVCERLDSGALAWRTESVKAGE